MNNIPRQVQGALKELSEHYNGFSEHNRGANGLLFFATNIVTNQEVAIKFYATEADENRHNEPRQLALINNPNVLLVLDARMISNEWGYFVTPRCHGGDLDDLIQTRPSVHTAIDVALGICHGVSALHEQGMLHRDLKPANIVIDQGLPRIADFGSVKALIEGERETNASRHSVLYRSPESFNTNRYNIKGDIYQVGLIVYQLLGGELSYEAESYLNRRELQELEQIEDVVDRSRFVDAAICRRAQRGQLIKLNSLPPWISMGAKREIRNMTHVDCTRRFSIIADVTAALLRMRGNLQNWQWIDGKACLSCIDRTIELRPLANGNYEPFQRLNCTFRRIPNTEVTTLDKLVRKLKRQCN